MFKVRDSASQVAEPARAAQEQEAAAKQARRQRFVATGPVRKSSRAGAVQTAARLQAQAEAHSSNDELSASPSSQSASDIEVAAEDSDASSQGRKRKRGTPEEEFDPAGNIMLNVTELSCILYMVAMRIFMCLFTCLLSVPASLRSACL